MNVGEPPVPRTVQTVAGRTIGYYDFGDPEGTPVIALHGTPASGAGFVWADEPARARGIRLLAPDRPGIGYTDRTPDGRVLQVGDYPPELFAFADALGIDRFPVLGYSGGGPYGLAAAHAAPERVRAAAIVASAGHVGEWAVLNDFDMTDRQMTKLATRAPYLARFTLRFSARLAQLVPRVSMGFAKLEMPPPDRAVVDKFPSDRAALALFTQAFLRTSAGVVDDYAALGRPWGFRVEEISVPVRCWHATADRTVPLRHTEELLARIPHAALTTWDDEAHLAVVDHAGEVLDGILELIAS